MGKRRKNETDDTSIIIALIIVGLILLWTYVIKPFIDWITQSIKSLVDWLSSNSTEIIYGVIIATIVIAIIYVFSQKEKIRFEEEQKSKGLIKFIDRFGKEKWGTPPEVDAWKNFDFEEEQKSKGLVKFTDKFGNTTWKSPMEIKRLEKEQFEEEQKVKGLIKFKNRFGKEKWGTPEEVKDWKMRDEEEKIKESLLYKVVESIKKFEPSREYRNEFGYHTELQGWLKANFPNAKVEIQTGASRPDIIIDDIAIEIKGPTDNQALNTLTTKCLKYSKYYKNIICVLFEPSFSDRNFREIQDGLQSYFPNVKMIIKK